VSLPNRLLGANPSIQVSTLLSGSLSTPSAKSAGHDSAFESIGTSYTSLVGAGGVSDITFTSIPSTYDTLQIRMYLRVSALTNVGIQFNGDTGSNYYWHELYADGGGVTSGSTNVYSSTSSGRVDHIKTGYVNANTSTSFTGPAVIEIVNYSSANKYKVLRCISGSNSNTTNTPDGYTLFRSGLWLNTSAITSVRFYGINSGTTIGQHSRISLYGIKGS
jgi:hypothetical protein